ncbi:unnamed protein product [Leptidea sinapis]|uniref:tRNA-dihydrouridine(47) synthase [NAD(P)(+)] n=1 Tax=Leptidea sinapis TaxID=189913 RepID=A0A5E4R2W6_9NEOP|nr:unnamed protein product [Leptidea sinapis]
MTTELNNTDRGVCHIKKEYILCIDKKNQENDTQTNKRSLEHDAGDNHEQDIKKCRSELEIEKAPKTKDKKRGQNKARPKTFHDDKQLKPCASIVNITSMDDISPCQYPNCKFIHDPLTYLKTKKEDIGDECIVFKLKGRCPRGISCRYGASHISHDGFNLIDEQRAKLWIEDTKNILQPSLQTKLQKKQYDFSTSEKLVQALYDIRNGKQNDNGNTTICNKPSGIITDEDLIKLLPREKKTIDWRDKLYLGPLTTVGNLPFRRICKSYGADITCGEMALCESLLKASKQEWALVKRHESEDLFGAQICGNNPYLITKVAQVLQENTELDFVDLNLGCPIDLVYKQGGGSAMMLRLSQLEVSVKGASSILNIPFTIKMRTGVYKNKNIAHNIAPKVAEWGASLITLHGRSRESRYTKQADWEYIEQCAKAASCPIYGNGDIFSYEDYIQKKQLAPSIQGVMIGRGALIKPWIFTEIKEQKLWDISSSERFEILKKFTNYGLEHWGSDTQGVEATRRFMLEWLSFLYRYVPVGLLERPPQVINERPPLYFGRDDLESLMASGNCSDWIKISEMLLGPVPDGFVFLPKHKANSY